MLAIVAIGCGGKQEDDGPNTDPKAVAAVIAKYEAAANARIEKLKAVGAKAKDASMDKGYGGPDMAIAHTKLDESGKSSKLVVEGNALLVYTSDLLSLDDLTKAPTVRHRHMWAGEVAECVVAVKMKANGGYPMYSDTGNDTFRVDTYRPLNTYAAEHACDALLKATHVIVADQTVKNATVNFAGSDKTFIPGFVEGTLKVFEIETGDYLGVKTFHAESSEKVEYSVNVDPSTGHQVGGAMSDMNAVSADLRQQVESAIDAAVKTF